MPSNKNAVIRYMYLDQMLSDRYNKYTCEDLLLKVNERLEFAGFPTVGGDPSDYEHYIKSGKRVIQLDIQALQDTPFNMEIDCSERLHGSPVYRYADPTSSLFSKQLSDEEKRLLQEVLNTLGQFSGLDNFEWLHDLQEKLNDRRAFGRTSFDHNNLNSRKIISFSSNEYLKGKNYLGTLFSLIANRKVVDIIYEPFGQPARSIKIYPYLLKQHSDRWYLIGTPLETPEFPFCSDFYVNLALDRIVAINVIDKEPYIDPTEDIEERFEDIIGVTYRADVQITDITLAINNNYVPFVETKPLHGSQVKFGQSDQEKLHEKFPSFKGYTFYGLKLIPNKEFHNLIARSIDSIVVVKPDNLRSEMLSELETTVSLMKTIHNE